ncbi:MAG: serine--tRNA ligase, partial [Candidatus Moranbacteria bacterium]|nr:serine--tRNA ligase [Candidatus Moranbacteria bacterium]
MLQINYIRQNKETVISRFRIKNFDATEIVENILILDEQRRQLQTSMDEMLAEANKIAKSIGQLIKTGKQDEAALLKEKSSFYKSEAKKAADELDIV